MSSIVDGYIAGGATSGATSATNSRYYGLGTATWTAPDGSVVRYTQRRIIPQPEMYATMRQYVVVQGDRIDNVAAKQIGDPLLFWILCDANAAMDPDDLTAQIGRALLITLPAGIGAGGMSG
jgi:hypothetical protein